MKRILFFVLITLIQETISAQSDQTNLKDQSIKRIDSRYRDYKKIAHKIWEYAEVGYKEVQSSALLQMTLKENGFTVNAGLADIPTAFVASYGEGSPVIGILAEFDALPGLSQQAIPEKSMVAGKDAGHACGHHLFGTASVAAGIEIKNLIAEKKLKGTIKVYGTPAEEGGSGKYTWCGKVYLKMLMLLFIGILLTQTVSLLPAHLQTNQQNSSFMDCQPMLPLHLKKEGVLWMQLRP